MEGEVVVDAGNCACRSGFEGDGRTTCEDINECEFELQKNTTLCGQAACCNLFGGYICVCDCGFDFEPVNKTCHDIDECALGTHACDASQICHNEIGHHSCSCKEEDCGIFMASKKFKQFLPCFKPEPYSP